MDVQTYLRRLAAIEEDAVSGSKAFPYSVQARTGTQPYWSNVLSRTNTEQISSDNYGFILSFQATLFTGLSTESGYTGEAELSTSQNIADVLLHFTRQDVKELKSTDYPARMGDGYIYNSLQIDLQNNAYLQVDGVGRVHGLIFNIQLGHNERSVR